jgi:transporter family-2 protein
MAETVPRRPNPLHLAAAFASGGLLTLMVHFNGELARYGGALFSSWAAHGVGTVFAGIFLAALYRQRAATPAGHRPHAPNWAYLGGLSGAVTVILTSATVNSPLALSGTLAFGLAGQAVFGIIADRFGLLGMPRRRPDLRDYGALALILAGSLVILLFGKVAA